MERRTKVNFQGKEVDALEMDFESKEAWSEYKVSDGTVIRLKPVATNIIKILNEYDASGKPVYIVQSSNVLGVFLPTKKGGPTGVVK
ncbi:MAG: hypothetical protein WAK96_12365 [Desulfobaccales bacterium]